MSCCVARFSRFRPWRQNDDNLFAAAALSLAAISSGGGELDARRARSRGIVDQDSCLLSNFGSLNFNQNGIKEVNYEEILPIFHQGIVNLPVFRHERITTLL